MTIKKMLLLALASMGLVAFAAPASANASGAFWWTSTSDNPADDVKVGESTAEAEGAEFKGMLGITSAAGAFTSGPCHATAEASLWNTATTGVGEVTNFSFGGIPCPTNIPGCEISEAEGTPVPWPIDVTGDHTIVIGSSTQPAGFLISYNDGCTGLGIPPGVPVGGGEGIATGTWNTETHCIDFNKAGHLTGPTGPVTMDGSLCPQGAENTLTLHT